MYIFSLQDADRERVVEAESLSSDLNDHPLLLVSVTSVSQSVSWESLLSTFQTKRKWNLCLILFLSLTLHLSPSHFNSTLSNFSSFSLLLFLILTIHLSLSLSLSLSHFNFRSFSLILFLCVNLYLSLSPLI